MKTYKVTVDHHRNIRWYKENSTIPHREDGPAVEYSNGDIYYLQHGLIHREEGPAVSYISGTKKWYINGNLHRIDGPALEWSDGNKEWYLNGIKFSEEQFKANFLSCEGKVVEIEGKKYKLVSL